MTGPDVSWIVRETVTGDRRGNTVHVRSADLARSCALSLGADGSLLFDGERVDVGDELTEYLAVMDEVSEHGRSEP